MVGILSRRGIRRGGGSPLIFAVIEPTVAQNSQAPAQQIQRVNIGGTLSTLVAAAKKRRFLAAGGRAYALLVAVGPYFSSRSPISPARTSGCDGR